MALRARLNLQYASIKDFGLTSFGRLACGAFLIPTNVEEMTESWGKLRLDVRDDEIIVSKPGTNYTVTYYKPSKSPQLPQSTSPSTTIRAGLNVTVFLSRAWRGPPTTRRAS